MSKITFLIYPIDVSSSVLLHYSPTMSMTIDDRAMTVVVVLTLKNDRDVDEWRFVLIGHDGNGCHSIDVKKDAVPLVFQHFS